MIMVEDPKPYMKIDFAVYVAKEVQPKSSVGIDLTITFEHFLILLRENMRLASI
jgi:hypothetical protein